MYNDKTFTAKELRCIALSRRRGKMVFVFFKSRNIYSEMMEDAATKGSLHKLILKEKITEELKNEFQERELTVKEVDELYYRVDW